MMYIRVYLPIYQYNFLELQTVRIKLSLRNT